MGIKSNGNSVGADLTRETDAEIEIRGLVNEGFFTGQDRKHLELGGHIDSLLDTVERLRECVNAYEKEDSEPASRTTSVEATMTWEYLFEDIRIPRKSSGAEALHELDSYGSEGWELVSIQALPGKKSRFFFKRPMGAEILGQASTSFPEDNDESDDEEEEGPDDLPNGHTTTDPVSEMVGTQEIRLGRARLVDASEA